MNRKFLEIAIQNQKEKGGNTDTLEQELKDEKINDMVTYYENLLNKI